MKSVSIYFLVGCCWMNGPKEIRRRKNNGMEWKNHNRTSHIAHIYRWMRARPKVKRRIYSFNSVVCIMHTLSLNWMTQKPNRRCEKTKKHRRTTSKYNIIFISINSIFQWRKYILSYNWRSKIIKNRNIHNIQPCTSNESRIQPSNNHLWIVNYEIYFKIVNMYASNYASHISFSIEWTSME